MKTTTFEQLTKQIAHLTLNTLNRKTQEYKHNEDVLATLKSIASFTGRTSQQECMSLMLKHLVSIRNIVMSGKVPSDEWLAEKLVDAMCYMMLLWALYVEDRDERTA